MITYKKIPAFTSFHLYYDNKDNLEEKNYVSLCMLQEQGCPLTPRWSMSTQHKTLWVPKTIGYFCFGSVKH